MEEIKIVRSDSFRSNVHCGRGREIPPTYMQYVVAGRKNASDYVRFF